MEPKTRICTQCLLEKCLETDFNRQSNGKYGRQSACRECTQRLLAEYRKTPKGKEKAREYARRHREKEGYYEKHRAYRETPKSTHHSYLKGAEKRALAFEFTVAEFTEAFWQKPCWYCGDPIRTAGVDRVDNAQGYTRENTVPCCYTCNLMKLKTSQEDFVAKCRQIAALHSPPSTR